MFQISSLIWPRCFGRTETQLAVQTEHYHGLDFLRGIAALAVVWFHCAVRLDLPLLFPHGYLAVDFFFVLSGFVIANAYYSRIESGKITIRKFAVLRIIRLMPLIALGTCLAAFIEIGRPDVTNQFEHLSDAGRALLFGLLLVPTLYPTTLELTIFPLNGPVWSLFLEAVANGAFVIWAKSRLGGGILPPLLLISGAVLLWGIHANGKIDFGHSSDDLWLGFFRVAYSFVAGVSLYYLKDVAPKFPLWLTTVCILIIFAAPIPAEANSIYDSIAVIILLPLLVLLATSVRSGPRLHRWATLSGDLSYPLYALHYPLIRVFGVVGLKLHFGASGRFGLVVIATVVSVIVSAWAFVMYDAPVRRKLSGMLLLRRRGAQAA